MPAALLEDLKDLSDGWIHIYSIALKDGCVKESTHILTNTFRTEHGKIIY